MADNYIEKQMEDYRRGQRKVVRQVALKTPTVLIIGSSPEASDLWVRKFRSFGWHTAFTDEDLTRGRALAQQTGAQHHPVPLTTEAIQKSIEYILARHPAIDLAILTGSTPIPIKELLISSGIDCLQI